MDNRSTFELASRLNEINIEKNKLDIEYNKIIEELWERIPDLKDNENIQKVKTKQFDKK
jgi:hypothetical protein